MASHFQPATRPRTLANVLLDLREAHDDYLEACAAIEREEADADDRASEADTRVDDLRAEFDVRLAEATGLTVEEFRGAYEAALI